MKRCPYCAEEIQDAAIKCKHCGEMLSTASGASDPSIDGVVREVLVTRGKIAAIKEYRNLRPGVGLAEGKDYVEKLESGLPPSQRIPARPKGCFLMLAVGGLIFLGVTLMAL